MVSAYCTRVPLAASEALRPAVVDLYCTAVVGLYCTLVLLGTAHQHVWEGRAQVWCDLGTDCEDCGVWVHRIPASQAALPIPQPIAQLVQSGVEVYVRDSVTSPEFR